MKKVLTIAGSDCSGGAGIQADLKTITAYGMYGMSAITALTVQNTKGVFDICEPDTKYLSGQLEVIFTDIMPDAVKIGMLSSPEIVCTVTEALKRYQPAHVVVDPVMVSTSGYSLAKNSAAGEAAKELYSLATVLTPNLPETEALLAIAGLERAAGQENAVGQEHAAGEKCTDGSERKIRSKEDMEQAAKELSLHFGTAVLVKGGHLLDGADDCLGEKGEAVWFSGERIETENTHGTGCTLSSAIACGLAAGWELPKAVECARWYLRGALKADPKLGHGNGPVNHCFAIPECFGREQL